MSDKDVDETEKTDGDAPQSTNGTKSNPTEQQRTSPDSAPPQSPAGTTTKIAEPQGSSADITVSPGIGSASAKGAPKPESANPDRTSGTNSADPDDTPGTSSADLEDSSPGSADPDGNSGTSSAEPRSTSSADTADTPQADLADPGGDSGWRARIPRLPRLGRAGVLALRGAAASLVAAAVGSSIYFSVQERDSRDLLAAQQQAREAACRYGPVLADYDAKDLDPYFAAVLAGATGGWKTQFDTTSKDLRDVLAKGQVVSRATDVQCAIRTADKSSAEAIVVIGQTITSLGTQGKPEPGQLSMVLRLEKDGDRWLVNKVDAPLAPPPQP